MDTKYNPQDFEKKIYKEWEDGRYFKAGVNPDKSRL